MFKPTIQNPTAVGGDLFPNIINYPCSVVTQISAPPDWWFNAKLNGIPPEDTVEQIVGQYQAQLWQFVQAQRQQRQLAGSTGHNAYRSWDAMDVQYIYNFGHEMVRITVYPTNEGGQTPVEVGSVLVIDIPFTGFPIPGMGVGGGSAYPDEFRWYGPTYPFDPCFVPNEPGSTSRVDNTTKFYKAGTPSNEPDLAGCNTASNAITALAYMLGPIYCKAEQDGAAVYTKDPAYTYGYGTQDYCKGVGGAAILTTPLSGKQYWEVKITKLPLAKLPDPYTLDTTGSWCMSSNGITTITYIYREYPAWLITGNFSQKLYSPIPYVYTTVNSASSMDVKFSSKVDTWATPSVGVVPYYYLPKDLQGAAPTDVPKKYLDYTRVPGLDKFMADIQAEQPPGKLARSIVAIASSTDVAFNVHTLQGVWEISVVAEANITGYGDYRAYYQDLQSWIAGGAQGAVPQMAVVNTGDTTWYPMFFYDSSRPMPGSTSDTLAVTEGTAFVHDTFIASCVICANYTQAYVAYGSTMIARPGVALFPIPFDAPKGGPQDGAASTSGLAAYNAPSPHTPNPSTLPSTTHVDWGGSGGSDVAVTYPSTAALISQPNAWPTNPEGGWFMYRHDGDLEDAFQLFTSGQNAIHNNLHIGGVPDGGMRWRFTPGFKDTTGRIGAVGSTKETCSVVGTVFQTQLLEFTPSSTPPVPSSSAPSDLPSGAELLPNAPKAFQQLFDVGYSMPVFIGRVDLLPEQPKDWSTSSLGDGSQVNLADTRQGSQMNWAENQVGMFTGNNLGKLIEGDVLMVATDTATGYVWFGKNGDWWAPVDGDVAAKITDLTQQGPSHGTKWTAVMDGYPKSYGYQPNSHTTPPSYHPALGYRIGPFKASIVYDPNKLKYPLPSGFKVYGQNSQ